MLLWRKRFLVDRAGGLMWPVEKRGNIRAICSARLNQFLEMPQGGAYVWIELHDRKARDRLQLTVQFCVGWSGSVWLEGTWWGRASSRQERLLRRLGLISGRRKCLWLEVWYREVE